MRFSEGMREFKAQADEWVRRAAAGEEVTITPGSRAEAAAGAERRKSGQGNEAS